MTTDLTVTQDTSITATIERAGQRANEAAAAMVCGGRVSQIVTSLDTNKDYNPEEAATRAETHSVIVRRAHTVASQTSL